ncbi:MAG: hypothetical protein IJX17_06145 [Clostridia bacterium]|nr:hypothetical protein [Clostridia bacterium]
MNEEKIFNFLGIEINKSEETNKLFDKVKVLANKAHEELGQENYEKLADLIITLQEYADHYALDGYYQGYFEK